MLVEVVKEKVALCVSSCVEDRKKNGFGFMASRKRFIPACQEKCNKDFAKELGEINGEQLEQQEQLNSAFDLELNGNNKQLFAIVGIVMLFLLIIVIIVF